jgi:hypothetical protein
MMMGNKIVMVNREIAKSEENLFVLSSHVNYKVSTDLAPYT